MTTNNNKDYQVKGVFNKMKQAVHYYNEMESKVLQATNMDAWGAPSSLMRSLAQGTMESEKLNIIMPALYRRLTVKESKQWLQVYKGLVLLEYLLKYGDDQVLSYAQSHQDVLNSLKTFEYIDEKGQDKGVNVRIRSKTVDDLVHDPEEINRIRQNGRLSQDRFIGVSSDDMIDNNSAMVSKKEDQEKEEKAINSSPIPPHSKQLPPVNQQQQQQQQQQQPSSKEQQTNDLSTDDMDNVIFREDFLDPLEEDNHAMVFSPTGGKGKMAPLTSDALDDDHDEQQHKSTQDTKKKSRFSFAGVFSRTKRQSTVTDASSEGKSQHDDSVTPSDVTISACEKEIQQTKSNVDNDEDGWGDFTSPNQDELVDQPEANVTGGTSNHQEELSIGQQQQQQEDDLLDLDCDVMTASTARTSVDNNELLLLDLDTPSFNTFTIQDNSNNIITQQYNQYPVTNIMTSNTIQKSHYGYQSSYPSQPTIPTLMRNNSNSYASDISSPTMNTPTSPFDFDPLGLGKNEYPQSNINQNKMTTTSPQQLTQPWYPWMATNNTSYQYHQEQKPLTVDDLLS